MARKTSCKEDVRRPCSRSKRSAYNRLEHDASRLLTWSVEVSWSLTIMPRAVILSTRSLPSMGFGSWDVAPRTPRALKIISFDLARFSVRLLSLAHDRTCSSSSWQAWQPWADTMMYVSSANFNISLLGLIGRSLDALCMSNEWPRVSLVSLKTTSASAKRISHHTAPCWRPKSGHPWGYRLEWYTIGTDVHFWIFDISTRRSYASPKIDPFHVDAHDSAVPGAISPKLGENLSEMLSNCHVDLHADR